MAATPPGGDSDGNRSDAVYDAMYEAFYPHAASGVAAKKTRRTKKPASTLKKKKKKPASSKPGRKKKRTPTKRMGRRLRPLPTARDRVAATPPLIHRLAAFADGGCEPHVERCLERPAGGWTVATGRPCGRDLRRALDPVGWNRAAAAAAAAEAAAPAARRNKQCYVAPGPLRAFSRYGRLTVHRALREILRLCVAWPSRVRSMGCVHMPGCTPDCDDDPGTEPGYCIFGYSFRELRRLEDRAAELLGVPVPSIGGAGTPQYGAVVGWLASETLRLLNRNVVRAIITAPLKADYCRFDLPLEDIADLIAPPSLRALAVCRHRRNATATTRATAVRTALATIALQIPTRINLVLRAVADYIVKHRVPATGGGPETALLRGFEGLADYARHLTERMNAAVSHRQTLSPSALKRFRA